MPSSTADNPVKIIGALARTYAQSLMDLAEQAGVVDEVADELTRIAALLDESDDLRAFFHSVSIHKAKRAASLEVIFRDRVSDLTYRFIQVVNDHDRLDQFARIMLAYAQLLMDRHGQVEVDLYTASPLPQDRVDAIAAQISRAINRAALVNPRVDEGMIGGMKLRIGDKLIDGSVATRLVTLRRRLIETGRETVRANARSMLEE
jgi:F-type H+-transporting ATPase subunit delta